MTSTVRGGSARVRDIFDLIFVQWGESADTLSVFIYIRGRLQDVPCFWFNFPHVIHVRFRWFVRVHVVLNLPPHWYQSQDEQSVSLWEDTLQAADGESKNGESFILSLIGQAWTSVRHNHHIQYIKKIIIQRLWHKKSSVTMQEVTERRKKKT